MTAEAPHRLAECGPASVIVQPEAEADLAEAFRWYEARKLGLGHEMIAEAGHAFARIGASPERPRALYRGTRRVRLRRFPYIVLYVPRDSRVYVLAVLHERRSPRLFRSRARGFQGGG